MKFSGWKKVFCDLRECTLGRFFLSLTSNSISLAQIRCLSHKVIRVGIPSFKMSALTPIRRSNSGHTRAVDLVSSIYVSIVFSY